METCFLCRDEFQFGPHVYGGKWIRAWGTSVCGGCVSGSHDGMVPRTVPHLLDHLKARAIEPQYNASGWISWPPNLGHYPLPGQVAAAGAVCYALVTIIGVPTCVRINHQIASWSIQNPPREWAQMRARWIRFHVIRTLFSVPAFAVYVLAAMSNTSR
jgi:hypothetical protein